MATLGRPGGGESGPRQPGGPVPAEPPWHPQRAPPDPRAPLLLHQRCLHGPPGDAAAEQPGAGGDAAARGERDAQLLTQHEGGGGAQDQGQLHGHEGRARQAPEKG